MDNILLCGFNSLPGEYYACENAAAYRKLDFRSVRLRVIAASRHKHSFVQCRRGLDSISNCTQCEIQFFNEGRLIYSPEHWGSSANMLIRIEVDPNATGYR